MKRFLTTNIGRLRILGFLEGVSLLVLVLIAVPVKYLLHDPALVKMIGPVHGMLFLLFVINVFTVGAEQRWTFITMGKMLLASFIPFGTFYMDHRILRPLHHAE